MQPALPPQNNVMMINNDDDDNDDDMKLRSSTSFSTKKNPFNASGQVSQFWEINTFLHFTFAHREETKLTSS